MLTFAIIGRPNVGKSTLFNVLTRTRNALVANESGLTRDRQMGKGQVGNRNYWLIDTGGLGNDKNNIAKHVAQQALLAARESTAIFFMVDGREGLTVEDENIAQHLRSFNNPIYLIINKIDGVDETVVGTEFHSLGFEKILYISASHQRGIQHLMDTVLSDFSQYPEDEKIEDNQSIKIAIVGRPNVGKSTLINRLLGEERVIVSEEAGTTRDSIAIPFERKGQQYILIDTAGVRRRTKVQESIEKISIIKTLQSIEIADVVVMLLDAQEGVTDQDASLLGQILDSGTALVVAVNKWDGLNEYQQEQARKTLSRKLHFIDFVDIHFMSALKGNGIGNRFFQSIFVAWTSTNVKISTNQLNQVLKNGIIAHAPPLVKGKHIRLRYIHQGGQHPPLFVIHGNHTLILPDSYKRYLINLLREKFALKGTPILLEFKQGENPYDTPEKRPQRNNR